MRTQREFLEALKKERNGWGNMRDGSIRCGRSGYKYCPITAVAKTLTGERYRVSQPMAAAKAIGLSRRIALQIITAADCHNSRSRLRKRILAALGLEEATR